MTSQKHKPLKNKIKEAPTILLGEKAIGYKEIFFFEDVKSAVQGLLEEIEEAIKYYTIQNTLNESTFRNERIEGLKIAKKLIKKWFPDVVENEKPK